MDNGVCALGLCRWVWSDALAQTWRRSLDFVQRCNGMWDHVRVKVKQGIPPSRKPVQRVTCRWACGMYDGPQPKQPWQSNPPSHLGWPSSQLPATRTLAQLSVL